MSYAPAPTMAPPVKLTRMAVDIGGTQGRRRYDRDKAYDKPRKDIWLRPLRRDWKRTLNR